MKTLVSIVLFLNFNLLSFETTAATLFDLSDEKFVAECNAFVQSHVHSFEILKQEGAFEEGFQNKQFDGVTREIAMGLVSSLMNEYGTFEYSPSQKRKELNQAYRAFIEDYEKKETPSEELNACVMLFVSLFNLIR